MVEKDDHRLFQLCFENKYIVAVKIMKEEI